MTDRMYEHFLSLEFWRYDDKETADTYEKARKFAQFFPYIFTQLGGLITQCFTMIAGLVALVLVSWWLGLIALVAIIPGIVIQLRLSRAQIAHWNSKVDNRRTVSWIEWDIMEVRHIAELRLYGLVRHLLDMRYRLRDEDQHERIDFERKYMGKRLGSDILEAATEVVALLWITMQIIHRAQPVGQFIYVQQVVSRAISGANSFVSQLSSIDEDVANLYDYERFMAMPAQQTSRVSLVSQPEQIVFDHVSFHYPGTKKLVLDDISLTIHKGQHVAVVGENGAGKSTFVKLLTGLYVPTKGRIRVDAHDLRDVASSEWHQYLGVLGQEFIKYKFGTAQDNVVYGDVSRPYSTDRFTQALSQAEAKDVIKSLPRGEDNYVSQWMEDSDGHKGQDLSGGQWQRLALARNFYRDSPIIILDEPTSAIDALAEARIFQRLFRQKKTIITISHRVTTIEKADVICMFEQGKIIEQGTHAELVAMRGRYYRMFQAQLHE